MEDPNCAAARGTIRELFSFHFGGDMHFSPGLLETHKRFLTTQLAENLKNSPPGSDPFALTPDDDPPKAFSVGNCKASGDKANLKVLIFWKTDTRSEQRELNVEAVKQNDQWLVNSISKP
jgi:hypothetical protein